MALATWHAARKRLSSLTFIADAMGAHRTGFLLPAFRKVPLAAGQGKGKGSFDTFCAFSIKFLWSWKVSRTHCRANSTFCLSNEKLIIERVCSVNLMNAAVNPIFKHGEAFLVFSSGRGHLENGIDYGFESKRSQFNSVFRSVFCWQTQNEISAMKKKLAKRRSTPNRFVDVFFAVLFLNLIQIRLSFGQVVLAKYK